MWEAKKLAYRGNNNYTRAYKGRELIWESIQYTLVLDEYLEGLDGQYYLKLVQYGEMIPGCTIETPGTSSTTYGFIEDTESSGKIAGYKYIMSDNKGKQSSWATAKISWEDFTSMTFYYRSYAESGYDYMMLSSLDFAGWTSLPSSSSGGVMYHTSGQLTTTFKEATYTCDSGKHHIWIAFRKDGSVDSNADRGYFGFIEGKQEILSIKQGQLLPSEYVWKGHIMQIGDTMYQKLEREYTLPNGDLVVNENDYMQGEELEMELAGWTSDARVKVRIPYNGSYFVLNHNYDVEFDVMFNNLSDAILLESTSTGDRYEYELFVNGSSFYYDIGTLLSGRLSITWNPVFGVMYNIKGSNGNYLSSNRSIIIDGVVKGSSTTLATADNTNNVISLCSQGKQINCFKVYDKNGLLFNLKARYKDSGDLGIYDEVNGIWCEITNSVNILPIYQPKGVMLSSASLMNEVDYLDSGLSLASVNEVECIDSSTGFAQDSSII